MTLASAWTFYARDYPSEQDAKKTACRMYNEERKPKPATFLVAEDGTRYRLNAGVQPWRWEVVERALP